jgi:hypothetical protein
MMRPGGRVLVLAAAMTAAAMGCSFPTEEFSLGPADTGVPVDTGVTPDDLGDTGPVDTGALVDTGSADTGVPSDTGPVDTGAPADTGAEDTGPVASDAPDSGTSEDAALDATADTGAGDASSDGGAEDTGPDVPAPIFCATSRPCPSGLVCDDGVCEPMCPTGQLACSGFCRAVQTDTAHCGACGTMCAAGQECRMGMCSTVCAAPTTNCSNVCRDLQGDNNHCGACGRACTGGTSCSMGSCQCPSGQSACSGVCTNVQSDTANCGGCGRRCTAGQLCSNGACTTVCAAGQTNCSGTCRDLTSDVSACGSCTNACRAPTGGIVSCAGSTCVQSCPRGRANCSGACVDTQSDNANCGACGRACTLLAACSDGLCCARGNTNCSGTCRNLQTDTANCGACGRVCASSQVCRAGNCEYPFHVTTLTASSCVAVQHGVTTGDDRGGIAANASYVLYTGDTATGRFNAADLAAPAAITSGGNLLDGLASDLGSGVFYSLSTGTAPFNRNSATGVQSFSRLLGINPLTGALTGTSIALSRAISVDLNATYGRVGIFSGYGRMIFYDGARAYNISLPGGAVTDLGAVALPNHARCENWAFWGVAEYFSNTFHVVYAQTETAGFPTARVVRTAIPTGTTSTVFTFASPSFGSDLCSLTVVPTRSRWYFHWEGTSQFGSGDEGLGTCSAGTTLTN